MQPPKAAQQGFGLLEALVALVLFAGVGVVAISWLQQSLSASVKMQRSLAETSVRKMMLDTVRSINLAANPSGVREIADYAISWQSEPVGKMEPQIGYPVGLGRHQVQLYKVEIIARPRAKVGEEIREEIVQVGHASFNNKTAGVMP